MEVLLSDINKTFERNATSFVSKYFQDNKIINLKKLWQVLYKEGYIGEKNTFLQNILLTKAACKAESGLGLFFLTQFTCIETVKNYATGDLKEEYLNNLISGENMACFSITEKNAGSDVSLLETTAKKENNDWIINGDKIWASNGSISDLIITFAQTKEYKDKTGITCFFVNSNLSGVKIENDTPKLGVKITPSNEVIFKNLKITENCQIASIGDGIKIALGAITLGRIYCAAQACGLMGGILQECINHSTKRNQFGKSISENQAIQWYLADIIKDLDASELLLYKACFAKENKTPELIKLSSMAKYFSTTCAQKHASKAVQILGGRGLHEDSYVSRAYRDSKVLEIYEGTNEIQKIIIGKELKLN